MGDGATASAPRGDPPAVGRRLLASLAVAAAALLALGAAVPAGAQEVLTQEEALELAFPDAAEVDRRTAFLDSDQLRRARELAGRDVEVETEIVVHYVARGAEGALGVAYFDSHRVRTLPEVLMVVVRPGGEVGRVEVLRFDEPREYLAPEGWLEEFRGMELGGRLSTDGDVHVITGATLTSRAVTRAVRRVLALHRVVDPLGEGAEDSGSEPPESDAARAGSRGGSAAGSDPSRPRDVP